MDAFLRRRASDPRFGAAAPRTELERYAALVPARHNASSQGPCWSGYHRDYHKGKYTDGSCVKDKPKDKTNKSQKKKKKPKKEGEASSSSSSDDDDDGKRKKKKAKTSEAGPATKPAADKK